MSREALLAVAFGAASGLLFLSLMSGSLVAMLLVNFTQLPLFLAGLMLGPKAAAIEFSLVNDAGQSIQYRVADREFTLPPRYSRTHEICRPSELKVTLSGSDEPDPKTKTFQPQSGDQFVVIREADSLSVKRE